MYWEYLRRPLVRPLTPQDDIRSLDRPNKKQVLNAFTFTKRCTYLLILECTKIYIKIHTKMLLHVSVCDRHQGACTWV